MTSGPAPTASGARASTCSRASSRASTRMGLDHVDIFYSHRFDPQTPLEETMGALDTAVRQGKALYAASAPTRPSAPRRRSRSSTRSARRCSSTSPPTRCSTAGSRTGCSTCSGATASARSSSRRSPRACSPTATSTASPRTRACAAARHFDEAMLSEENLARVRALNEIAARRGQTLAQLAIAWVLRDPRVSSALLGASSVAQLEQNVAALDRLDFSAEELAEIDRYARRRRRSTSGRASSDA